MEARNKMQSTIRSMFRPLISRIETAKQALFFRVFEKHGCSIIKNTDSYYSTVIVEALKALSMEQIKAILNDEPNATSGCDMSEPIVQWFLNVVETQHLFGKAVLLSAAEQIDAAMSNPVRLWWCAWNRA